MSRFLMRVQYCGDAYYGWQRQIDGQTTIQSVVEAAICDLFGQEIKILGAGRTDRGVHARGMPAHFNVDTRLRGEELRRAIDVRLPDDVTIREIKEVAEDFHCRYHTRGKLYSYRIHNSRVRSPLTRDAYFFPRKLDIERMRSAAQVLIGKHDFSSFATLLVKHPGRITTQPDPSIPDKPQGNIRRLHEILVMQRGEVVSLLFFGDGFLRGMVRALVGTLLLSGIGKIGQHEVEAILQSKDRTNAGANVPACGLTLERVFYEDAEREAWLKRAREVVSREEVQLGGQLPWELV